MIKITGSRDESLFGEFELLRTRPGMVCSGKDIRLLIGYLDGRRSYKNFFERGIGNKASESDLYIEFKSFIQIKYEKEISIKYPTHDILLKLTGNDGEKAFDLFFEIFDDFILKKNITFNFE